MAPCLLVTKSSPPLGEGGAQKISEKDAHPPIGHVSRIGRVGAHPALSVVLEEWALAVPCIGQRARLHLHHPSLSPHRSRSAGCCHFAYCERYGTASRVCGRLVARVAVAWLAQAWWYLHESLQERRPGPGADEGHVKKRRHLMQLATTLKLFFSFLVFVFSSRLGSAPNSNSN